MQYLNAILFFAFVLTVSCTKESQSGLAANENQSDAKSGVIKVFENCNLKKNVLMKSMEDNDDIPLTYRRLSDGCAVVSAYITSEASYGKETDQPVRRSASH
jgi:hypothetical protein